MINIGLDGGDEVVQKVISLPQVPGTGEYLYLDGQHMYRVDAVHWADAEQTRYDPPVMVVLWLERC